MKGALGGLAVGYLTARLAWIFLGPLFAAPVLARPNYRGRPVPTAAGILLPVVALAVEGGRALVGSFGVGDAVGLTGPRALVLVAAAGFAVLGLLDDLLGSPRDRGFRGHVPALLAGQVTTGGLKLLGGGAVALLVVAPVVGESPGRLVADALLVALAANLANLFDRAPGRVTKGGAAAFAVLLVGTGGAAGLTGAAVVVGATLGLLLDDLHEHLMLGDAGANALGAVLGLAVVLSCGPPTRDVVLVGVGLLNVAGELVSLGRVIDAFPPLRAADRAGRRA